MSGSDGIISSGEIAVLADLFDRSELAFDPTSDDCKEAAIALTARLEEIYGNRIKPASPQISHHAFSCAIRKQLRAYIRKNG